MSAIRLENNIWADAEHTLDQIYLTRNKEADSESYKDHSSVPFIPEGVGPAPHETVITEGDHAFTGVGWSRGEDDRKAGEKCNSSEWD